MLLFIYYVILYDNKLHADYQSRRCAWVKGGTNVWIHISTPAFWMVGGPTPVAEDMFATEVGVEGIVQLQRQMHAVMNCRAKRVCVVPRCVLSHVCCLPSPPPSSELPPPPNFFPVLMFSLGICGNYFFHLEEFQQRPVNLFRANTAGCGVHYHTHSRPSVAFTTSNQCFE